RYWLRPILPVHVSAALLSTNLLAIRNQARAASAGDDLPVEDGKQRHLYTFCLKRNVNSPQRHRDTEDLGICACFGFTPDPIGYFRDLRIETDLQNCREATSPFDAKLAPQDGKKKHSQCLCASVVNSLWRVK